VLALSQRKQVHRSNDDGLELDAKRVDLLREAVPGPSIELQVAGERV
jgi:hypothetical protein